MKGKGEKERYTHLNAEFQRIPRIFGHPAQHFFLSFLGAGHKDPIPVVRTIDALETGDVNIIRRQDDPVAYEPVLRNRP